MRARFDLLTSFRQADVIIDEWYNVIQAQVVLAKYPQELLRYYREIYSISFYEMNHLFPRP